MRWIDKIISIMRQQIQIYSDDSKNEDDIEMNMKGRWIETGETLWMDSEPYYPINDNELLEFEWMEESETESKECV